MVRVRLKRSFRWTTVGSSFNSKAVNKLTKPQTSNHHTKLRALKLKIWDAKLSEWKVSRCVTHCPRTRDLCRKLPFRQTIPNSNRFKSWLKIKPMTTVHFKLSDAKPWTAEELQRIKSIRDEDIDYSDIPPTTPEDWKKAVRGKFCKPAKKSATRKWLLNANAAAGKAASQIPVGDFFELLSALNFLRRQRTADQFNQSLILVFRQKNRFLL